MMLHTVVDYNVFLGQMQPPAQEEWVSLKNGMLELDQVTGTVRRVCSTDLKDYLNLRYAPGTLYRKTAPQGQNRRIF